MSSPSHILIVEDDAKVRLLLRRCFESEGFRVSEAGTGAEAMERLTARRLGDLGYRVLEAGQGAEALAVLAQAPAVDIIFSDLVMAGGMSGIDLAREVRTRYPHIPVVLTSGYSAGLMDQADLAELNLQVLRKPYRQAELARMFRAVLDRGKAQA